MVTLNTAKRYLLSCTMELKTLPPGLFMFIGCFVILEALGRALFMNPSNLLINYLPEKYSDDLVQEAIQRIDTYPVCNLSLNQEDDEVFLDLLHEEHSHLAVSHFMVLEVNGQTIEGCKVKLDGLEFVNDVEELIKRVFKEAEESQSIRKKLRAGFNLRKFIGLATRV